MVTMFEKGVEQFLLNVSRTGISLESSMHACRAEEGGGQFEGVP